MEISACPACGTTDIRLEMIRTDFHPLASWRAGESRPVFVAQRSVVESSERMRVVCVNGHAHPDRVGFDLEWAESG